MARFLFVFLLPTIGIAETASEKTLIIDRLALVLTGKLASTDQRQAYLDGTKTLVAIADQLRDSEDFERNLAYFYQEKLRITEPIEFNEIYTFINDGNKNFDGKIVNKHRVVGGKLNIFNIIKDTPENTIASYADQIRNPQKYNIEQQNYLSQHLKFRKPNNGSAHYFMQLFMGNRKTIENLLNIGILGGYNDKPITADLQEDFKLLKKTLNEAQYCNRSSMIDVTPYWNSEITVKACPATVTDKFCGANFANCFPYVGDPAERDPANFYRRKVAQAMTLEPGIMMAKTVREQKKYSQIVTTSLGVVNGHYLHFLKNFDRVISKQYQRKKSWDDNKFTANDRLILTIKDSLLNSYPKLAEKEIDLNDHSYQWIERGGDQHAGILTTIAFQRSTNGWRAKANKARSALLCREFIDPVGAKADPNDQRKLEERAYCGDCHKYLEPLSRFFHRWPDTGNDNNYFYDHFAEPLTTSYQDSYCPKCQSLEGNDVKGFAEIMTSSDDGFKQCAVRQAFEYVIKRQMDADELRLLLPGLVEIYDDNKENLWMVMRQIISMKIFWESSNAQAP